MNNRTIQQEEITITNTHAPNHGAFDFIKQTLMNIKDQINIDIIIEGDLNALRLQIDQSHRKINKEIELHQTYKQTDLKDIYTVLHPKTE